MISRTAAVLGLSALLCLALGFAWAMRSAKSGDEMRLTYIAYHLGLLGDVESGNCRIRMTFPWMPKLPSYRSLVVQTQEVPFVDISKRSENGKAVFVSFINRPERLSESMLEAPRKVGGLSVRYVKRIPNVAVKATIAWLPESGLFVAGDDPEVFEEALQATSISCGGEKVGRWPAG